jgi:hypothetical protein
MYYRQIISESHFTVLLKPIRSRNSVVEVVQSLKSASSPQAKNPKFSDRPRTARDPTEHQRQPTPFKSTRPSLDLFFEPPFLSPDSLEYLPPRNLRRYFLFESVSLSKLLISLRVALPGTAENPRLSPPHQVFHPNARCILPTIDSLQLRVHPSRPDRPSQPAKSNQIKSN